MTTKFQQRIDEIMEKYGYSKVDKTIKLMVEKAIQEGHDLAKEEYENKDWLSNLENMWKKQGRDQRTKEVLDILDKKINDTKEKMKCKVTDNMYSFLDGLIRNLEEIKQSLGASSNEIL